VSTNQRAQIVMTAEEITDFIERSRTATIATIGPTGMPHLVAMWYGVVDGKICIETKAKSQKAQNLLRDPRIVCMIEAGEGYDELRGVSIEGTATILDDVTSDEYWAAGVNVYERYMAPYAEDQRVAVEIMMNKRVVVRIEPTRVRSWDHRKLGMPSLGKAGSTADLVP
jgi:PPOX class probable F420-dependent enzyme